MRTRHGPHNRQVKLLIQMHRTVPEASHPYEPFRQITVYPAGSRQQIKSVRAGLGHPQVMDGAKVHGDVYAGLAGPLHIENQGVLMREAVEFRIRGVLFTDPTDATFNDRSFAENDIVQAHLRPNSSLRPRHGLPESARTRPMRWRKTFRQSRDLWQPASGHER